MYVFNRITVMPQLPERIRGLSVIANNLWWSWNTEYLQLFKMIDIDLWENVGKNPVKFLSLVSQERLDSLLSNRDFLEQYDEIYGNFNAYMQSKNTWFSKNYPNNRNDVIAYFSAEYGLDEILPIYSGGLGILSGDHLKSSSDLGIPLIGVGLLYKNGYFHQEIDGSGFQKNHYTKLDIENLPIVPMKDEVGDDLYIEHYLPEGKLFLRVWSINVGRTKLFLMDSDNEKNKEEFKGITSTLYGGNQENRIRQEIVLGVCGTKLLKRLGIEPTVYHMNEGHSSFLILELVKKIMEEKEVSFNIAMDIVSSKTVFTTHTPVPAGNDIFPLELIEKYFEGLWDKYGISKEDFFKLGMAPKADIENNGFNMGILALKTSGKKNAVSKLHREVSSELFAEVWPNIISNESPITYVTNGIHTCTWLAPNLKRLYNKYLMPYWQDYIYDDNVWKEIENIPDYEIWNEHLDRKRKLIALVKNLTAERLKKNGFTYDQIVKVTGNLSADKLTIGFARRFATYKRATLIFRDLEHITQILNNEKRPVQIIYAGKAHPDDREGQELIKFIHELSLKPQFIGKLFVLEDYNIGMSRYLISGVDVWLNNPRRPLEASGTSGQKAAVNGVLNFSVLDGWWAEGYNTKNGWKIGREKEYTDYESQDDDDAESLYSTLENKIVPTYYDRDEMGVPVKWTNMMKESIITSGGRFSTSRMLEDYMEKMYIPLCNLTNKYYNDLLHVTEFNAWKKIAYTNWKKIIITQEGEENVNNETIDAGNSVITRCKVKLPNLSKENIEVQVYCGQILDNGKLDNISIVDMDLEESDDENKIYTYKAEIDLKTGGNYGYTFRVMPKHPMLLNAENMNLVKWIEE